MRMHTTVVANKNLPLQSYHLKHEVDCRHFQRCFLRYLHNLIDESRFAVDHWIPRFYIHYKHVNLF